jgi:N-acetyl-gamma-glutamyl-phosphate reductase
MKKPCRVVVYGAGGYGGVGLVEILRVHPGVELVALVSREGAGEPYSKLYPHLRGLVDMEVVHAEEFDPNGIGDLVFFSTPDGVGQKLAKTYLDAGYRVIDFSGDFRFQDSETFKAYSAWQQGESDHVSPELLSESVYGCPEFNREALSKARLVGNPGCMAMSCLLALMPAVKMGAVEMDRIVLDVKTGISGAGKKPKPLFHYPSADGNSYAYKVGCHQHLFEIERHLSMWSGREAVVNFTPHVIPTTRGILSTCVLPIRKDVALEDVVKSYEIEYDSEGFVQVERGGRQELSHVKGTNLCRLGLHPVERSHTLVVTSAIDNLQKGQSGNAIQVMNLMLDLEESLGLSQVANYP